MQRALAIPDRRSLIPDPCVKECRMMQIHCGRYQWLTAPENYWTASAQLCQGASVSTKTQIGS